MLVWNQLCAKIESADTRHHQLAAQFEKFANCIAQQTASKGFHFKGIASSLYLERGFFTTTFASRTLHFVFTSVQKVGGGLEGNVKCYLKREVPETVYLPIGEFDFTGNGRTNLVNPEDDDHVIMNDDIPALYLVLHFIHESLSQ
ncbi:hypothetical protein VVD49_15650 [Uliginosibacterium sp. H3]|uniref:Uncharacterized protein n=1 Tax=Uliginosibacterium silvisoli TaxID=3114758 RepID=A0ABU6K6E7_9RHOO|nr:hypothetical protein [Uliginosibacterium sp. H3]